MKFSLRKAKYSWELYLGYIVAIPLITTCCFGSEEQKYQEELTREMYKHSWRAHLSETWKCADIKANTWWKAEIYEDSIFEVIPQAIADCITHNAEFDERKFTELQQDFNVIEFHGATPDKMKYSGENWNAVVLWNFLYRAMCIDPGEKDYQKILDDIMVALSKYYASYNSKSKEALKKLNKTYGQELKRARYDIQQYIETQGVNLIKYIKEIKQISEEDRKIRAPYARIEKQNKEGTASVIASYPYNNVDLNPMWLEYRIEYTQDMKATVDKKQRGWLGIPTYRIPEGVVEYTNEVKGKKNSEIYGEKIFKLTRGDEWKKLLMNEIPVKYSLSYRIAPKDLTKADLNENAVQFFSDTVKEVSFNGMTRAILQEIEITSVSATVYMNMMMQKGWSKAKTINELKIDDTAQDEIKLFRETFNLSEDDYSDEKLLEALQENNFNYEDAFNSLFN